MAQITKTQRGKGARLSDGFAKVASAVEIEDVRFISFGASFIPEAVENRGLAVRFGVMTKHSKNNHWWKCSLQWSLSRKSYIAQIRACLESNKRKWKFPAAFGRYRLRAIKYNLYLPMYHLWPKRRIRNRNSN